MNKLLTLFALSLLCFGAACGGDDGGNNGGKDGGPDDDGSVMLMDGATDDGGLLSCKGSIQCTNNGSCGVAGYECQTEFPYTLGGADDPIADDPNGENASYDQALFEGGYCTKNQARGNDDQMGCQALGCDSCSECIQFFSDASLCLQKCTPSLDNNDCAGHNSCAQLSSTEGVCIPGECHTDDECHIARVDSNNDGTIDSTNDHLQYFDGTGDGDITGFTASCDQELHTCHHSGTTGAEAGQDCKIDFDCEADGRCVSGKCTKFGCDLPGGSCAGDGQCVDGACVAGCAVGDTAGDDPFADHNTCGAETACVPIDEPNGDSDGACQAGNFNEVRDNNVGEPCLVDTDCYSPFGLGICTPLQPGSSQSTGSVCSIQYCSAFDANFCGSGNTCIALGDGVANSLCVKDCENGNDCSAGTECIAVSQTLSACITGGCDDDGQCGAGVCNTTDQVCEQSCTTPANCSDSRACTTQSGGGKQCTLECSVDSECPTGTGCNGEYFARNQQGNLVRFGTCTATCEDSGDCTGDRICAPGNGTGTQNVCTSYCSAAGQCPNGKSCDTLNATLKVGVCTAECASAADCDDGQACRESTTGDGKACSDVCSATGDCREGETCDKSGGGSLGFCTPE